jgi:hypothetical protein
MFFKTQNTKRYSIESCIAQASISRVILIYTLIVLELMTIFHDDERIKEVLKYVSYSPRELSSVGRDNA